jgi:hypothetical protein
VSQPIGTVQAKSMIVRKSGFISDAVATRFLDFGLATDVWDKYPTGSPWDGRIIHHGDMPESMQDLIVEVLSSVKAAITTHFGLANEIYPDDFTLVRWLTNDDHEPHADSANPDGRPHPFFWRKYTAVIYLNKDFQGGELYFPNQSVRLSPEPNSLAFFPGTVEYLHGVKMITSGTRYTLASFWTDDATKCIYPSVFLPA